MTNRATFLLWIGALAVCLAGCETQSPAQLPQRNHIPPEFLGPPVGEIWDSINEVIGSAADQELETRQIDWDEEKFLIDVPPEAEITVVADPEEDGVSIRIALPSGVQLEFTPGWQDIDELQMDVQDANPDIASWPYLDSDLLIMERDVFEDERYSAYMNLPIAYRQFTVRAGDAGVTEQSLDELLKTLAVASTLRLAEPLPTDVMSLAARLQMRLFPKGAASPEDVVGVKFGRYPTGDQVGLLNSFPNLRNVELSISYVEGSDLLALVDCPSLTTLQVTGNGWFDSAEWEAITACSSLTTLMVPHNSEPEALRWLGELYELRALDLGRMNEDDVMELIVLEELFELRHLAVATYFSGAELQFVEGTPDLESLQLTHLDLEDLDLAPLSILYGLQRVHLGGRSYQVSDAPFTGQQLVVFSNFRRLKEMTLSDMPLTYEGVSVLSRLRQVNNLTLERTTIDEEALMLLAHMEGLTELHLSDNHNISEAAIQRLRAAAPHLQIF